MTTSTTYELLDPDFHKNLCIDNTQPLKHAADISLTSAGLNEVAVLASCMPVVVVEATSRTPALLSAVMSLGQHSNLFYQNQKWAGHAIPLSLQCAPFNYARQDDQLLTVLDIQNRRVGSTGEALYGRDRSPTPYLKQMQQRLRHLFEGQQQALQFVDTLKSLNLLAALTIDIHRTGNPVETVTGCATINEARLAELSVTNLQRLHQSGFLMVIHSMLVSLQQYNRLVQLSHNTPHPIATVSLRSG